MPLAIVLWVALLVLGVLLWQKTPPPGYVPAKGVGPGQIGSVILAVLYGGFWVWVVGGLAERKSRAWANVTAAITLGFAGLMLGLSYAGLSADQRRLANASTGASVQSGAGASATNAAPSGGPGDQGVHRMKDQLARQNQPGLGQPAPMATPVQPRSAPGLPSGPGGDSTIVRPGGGPTSAPTPPKEHPSIRPVTAELEKELLAAIEALAIKAEEIVPVLSKPVAHDLRDVRKRIDDVQAMRTLAEGVSKRLGSAIDELKGRLVAAGVPESEAFHQSVLWTNTFGAAGRGFAAGDYARLGERANEELIALKDDFGKWTLNAKRELVTRDAALKQRLETLRFFVRTESERHADIKRRLKGN